MPKLTVKDFYSTFDFGKMLKNAPREIQEFLNGEIDYIGKMQSVGSILEIGCGQGRLLPILSKKAQRVVGIDFSKKLLQKVNLEHFSNVEVREMDAKRLLFEDEQFDYTVCLDATFGNMPGIEEGVLVEMKRVTKKGGKVIISVFSEKAKDSQIVNYTRLGLKGVRDIGNAVVTEEGLYSRRFTKEELITLFNNVGLDSKIESVCPINYIISATK